MLATSDAWSKSQSSQWTSEPVYYIVDCRILTFKRYVQWWEGELLVVFVSFLEPISRWYSIYYYINSYYMSPKTLISAVYVSDKQDGGLASLKSKFAPLSIYRARAFLVVQVETLHMVLLQFWPLDLSRYRDRTARSVPKSLAAFCKNLKLIEGFIALFTPSERLGLFSLCQ